ncbi:DUF1538 domain-containing protein [Ornithinibacillus halotolerans]|uniref:DUF1538 domain-containing protein n=1 Tax=Ornithinibacillus halotolerans TaxID=1274357 RepID=A0A916WBM0_9BACI|nr:DUF1538 domain-containing protein [Ornithinibacillus halotolerans]GGA83319.1 hypothetical protein GCM10008025_28100 [Ornithinibacillus halotolerans]
MSLHIFEGFSDVLLEVLSALTPLAILFLFFQIIFLKLPMRRIFDIGVGFLLTFLGLSIFLQGVHIGFLPVGEIMGQKLGSLSYKWILLPVGFVIGFFVVYAEPAVAVLTKQVEKVSGGYIPGKILLYTLSIGVGLAIVCAFIRIFLGISLWYFIVPGYIIALIMVKFSSKTFTSIAFDSGGVATGPMTATFLLALFVGVAGVTDGRDPLLDGFGMVALVALAPILSVLTLGILYGRKEKKQNAQNEAESKAYYHDR